MTLWGATYLPSPETNGRTEAQSVADNARCPEPENPMTTEAEGNPITVRVVSVDTTFEPPTSKKGDLARVVLQIGGPEMACSIPILVSRTHFDDQDIIPIARHYLLDLAQQLVSGHADWQLSADEFARRQLPQKASPNTDRTQGPS
jgi:hypothetical protein